MQIRVGGRLVLRGEEGLGAQGAAGAADEFGDIPGARHPLAVPPAAHPADGYAKDAGGIGIAADRFQVGAEGDWLAVDSAHGGMIHDSWTLGKTKGQPIVDPLCVGSGDNIDMDRRDESGQRLRLARQLRGHQTLGDLSAATNFRYSETRLSNYETGFRAMLPDVASDLGRVLQCSPAWLLCLDEAPEALSPREAELLADFREVDERGRAIIARVAETVAEIYRAERAGELYRVADGGDAT